MPLIQTAPQDHPTFKRAIALASDKALGDPAAIARQIAQAQAKEPTLGRDEAASLAVAQLAQSAYEEAVDSLRNQSPRAARIEYAVSGEEFLSEALSHLAAQRSEAAAALAAALKASQGFMPEKVLVIHELGLLEDGLICGRSKARAVGGNFAALQRAAFECLENLAATARLATPERMRSNAEAMYGWEDDDEAPSRFGLRLAAMELAGRCLPRDGADCAGQPLSSCCERMAARLAKLPSALFGADGEAPRRLSGPDAGRLLEELADAADRQRPGAAALSNFLFELGC